MMGLSPVYLKESSDGIASSPIYVNENSDGMSTSPLHLKEESDGHLSILYKRELLSI